jgi:hypothetical protein
MEYFRFYVRRLLQEIRGISKPGSIEREEKLEVFSNSETDVCFKKNSKFLKKSSGWGIAPYKTT